MTQTNSAPKKSGSPKKDAPKKGASGKTAAKAAPKPAPSTVYFAGLRARNARENKISKVAALFKAAGFGSFIPQDALIAVKAHFGERGNDTFINPVFARAVVDAIKAAGGKPFLTDSNTLYKGSRHNAVDHMITALEHGFSYATVGAPVLIADGLRGSAFHTVTIGKKHFSTVKIASSIAEAESMIVLSHFKGHEMAGFGGAIKNLAMGCSPSQGKCEQHASRFFINGDRCVACGQCVSHCPQDAIAFEKREKRKVAVIDKERCIGCGECLTVCRPKAVSLDWATEMEPFIERMVEYAYGATRGKEKRTGYITFLMNITPDCDCAAWSDTPLVPDIGILASTDPVALDKACLDLVNAEPGFHSSLLSCGHGKGEDKFKGAWSHTRGDVQISYAEKVGLGSSRYELVRL